MARKKHSRPEVWVICDPTRCFYCEREFPKKHVPKSPLLKTKDHVIPPRKNGKPYHLFVPACLGCNTSKGSMSLYEFYLRVVASIVANKKFRKVPFEAMDTVKNNIIRLIDIASEQL